MSRLSDIVKITISRETQSIAVANFGTAGIISEFPATKTTTTFDRYRFYGALSELLDDGWLSTDKVYIKASKIFSQNPVVEKILVGRKKPNSEAIETWTAALTEIQNANSDWYAFTILATQSATVSFDIDFVTGNNIDFVINGTAVTTVPFNIDNATTYANLKTQIETDITDSVVTVDDIARTVIIEIESGQVNTTTVSVTGGATQAVGTVAFTTEDDIKETAAWAETQKKIYFVTSNDSDIPTTSSSDLASDLKALGYDRTIVNYHPNLTTDDQYFSEGWIGEALPYNPGSQTWAYKTISGITAYILTSGERTNVLGKNTNIYTVTAGVSNTEAGKVISGEWIDIIRGIDWLEARLAENIFSKLVQVRKIPYTDEGVAIIEGLIKEVLNEAVQRGLITSEYIVTVPRVIDVPTQDKIDRILPDVKFTAILQGAIHIVEIQGIVTV